MNNNAICKKVSSMLSLYLDNRLAEQDRILVESHLKNCDLCRKKYLYLKSLIKNLKDSYRQIVELSDKKRKRQTFSIREYQNFLEDMSPYIDNELDTQQCYEFRKYLMKSKIAQKELKTMYSIQKQLRNAYNHTRNNIALSVSKEVMSSFRNNKFHLFDSVILEWLFSVKTAKIAILAGIFVFSAYGITIFDTPLKNPAKHVIEIVQGKVSSFYSER